MAKYTKIIFNVNISIGIVALIILIKEILNE